MDLTRIVFCFALALGAALPASAHKASDAYLQLRGDARGTELRIDVALRDLDAALDLDADLDGRLTWGEVRAASPAIEAWVRAGVQLEGCPLEPAGQALERRNDGSYAVLTLRSACAMPGLPRLRYALMQDLDATHRGLLKIEAPRRAPVLQVLDPATGDRDSIAPAESPGASASLVLEGVRHIVGGFDHLLFLLCLMLPAVMRRAPGGGWRPVDRPGQALGPVARIVTAFTLAHSITLGLAATGRVALSPALIEPAIAATIVLAAIDNLRPIFAGRRGLVTFVFGLVHGFGFAGVLGELDLGTVQFAWALLQFNVGLELGQLAVVAAAVGVLYLLRGSPRYPAWAIGGGSALCGVVGALWFVERVSGWPLLPV